MSAELILESEYEFSSSSEDEDNEKAVNKVYTNLLSEITDKLGYSAASINENKPNPIDISASNIKQI